MKALILSSHVQVRAFLRTNMSRRMPEVTFEVVASFDFVQAKLKSSQYHLLILHVENLQETEEFFANSHTDLPSVLAFLGSFNPDWHPQLLKMGVCAVVQDALPQSLMNSHDSGNAAEQEQFLDAIVTGCKKWLAQSGENQSDRRQPLKHHSPTNNPNNDRIISQSIKAHANERTSHKSSEPGRKVGSKFVSLASLVRNFQPDKFSCLLIASSTGGPEALTKFFRQINNRLTHSIFIVQHMPAGFTQQLARTLNGAGACSLAEASANTVPAAGEGIIAPGDWHLRLRRNAGKLEVFLTQTELVNSVRPAADLLFEDAVDCFSLPPLAIVFTGMGEDGCRGAAKVVAHGGLVLTQSEESCAVYGMPRAVDEANLSSATGTPEELGQFINQFFAQKTIARPA